jgi:drug/metabolite transporter (DMT)-like permease
MEWCCGTSIREFIVTPIDDASTAQAVDLKSEDPGILDYALLVLLAVLWGSSYAFIKIAVETVPPLTTIAIRAVLAGLLLTAVAAAQGHRLDAVRGHGPALLMQALLNSILPFTLIAWSLLYIDSGLAGILNATPPIFVLLITFLWTRHEPVTAASLFGVAAGIGGVALMIGVDALSGLGRSALAQLAVTAASLCYGVAAIYGRRFNAVPPAVTGAGTMIWAAVILVPLSLVFDRPWTLSPSAASLAALFLLSAFCTALALILYFRLIRTLGSMGLSTNSYLRVAVSVVVGVAFLGESVGWTTAVGLILILTGVATINRAKRAGGRNSAQ